LSGILTVRSGGPINITDGFDYPAMGAAFVAPRPNVKAGRNVDSITTDNLIQWFDPLAFALPPAGELGNVGRNVLVGPHMRNVDFSLLKDTAVPPISEQFCVPFRAEFFNIFNHANWGNPNNAVFVSGGAPNPLAGQISTLAAPMRQIQFALKFVF
jgi:hypothetical protein